MIDADGVVRQVDAGYFGIDAVVSGLSAIAPDTGVQITSEPNPVTTHTDATIGFTTSGGMPAQCSVDGEPYGPCSSPLVLNNVALGDHQVAISTGATWPALVSWRVISLDTTITGGPGSDFTPAFTFTGGDSFLCWTDNEAPSPCFSGEGIFNEPEGNHTFHVAAVDAYGNVDDTPATASYTTQPLPTITLVPDKANPTSSDSVTWTVTVTDATSGDPVTGTVAFYGPSDIEDDVVLDANGTASHLEPPCFFSYDMFVYYLGDESHGAEYTQAHVNVS